VTTPAETSTRHLEFLEQKTLFDWARKMRIRDDDVMDGAYISDYLYAIPNGGTRATTVDDQGRRISMEAKRLRASGVMGGVSDLHCPLSRCGYHSIYIEMKRQISSFKSFSEAKAAATDSQLFWIEKMRRAGVAAAIAYGWYEASELLLPYFNGDIGRFKSHYQKLTDRFDGLSRRSVASK